MKRFQPVGIKHEEHGLAVGRDGVAHPVCSDTRNPIFGWDPDADVRDLFFIGYGADIYTARIDLGQPTSKRRQS